MSCLCLAMLATVAALSGDAPLLLPFPRGRGRGGGGRAMWYEREGNGGRPMRGFFWMEDANTSFARAVEDPSVRYRV